MNKDKLYDYDAIIRNVYKKHYKHVPVPFDDIYQIGYIGYTKGIRKVNVDKYKISQAYYYICMYIRNEINTSLEIYNPTNEVTSNSIDISLCKERFTKDDAIERETLHGQIREYVQQLPRKHKDIINILYLNEHPKEVADVAKKYKVSRQAVDLWKQAAIKELCKLISKGRKR